MRTVLAAALVMLTATPAAAETPSAFVLARSVDGQTQVTTTLVCDGAGSTHPRAAEACAELRRAGGRFEALNVKPDAICTKEYLPHTAIALGAWQGRLVVWRKTFGNRCVMSGATGSVFDF
ncbi:SSI family serine proteinase inhibitor [Herbidospora cretacea]|uniref:SSI family serine proteinase inhibitor n=1 Tax=Herbidospora cretacea TaxID=28444 RepID=UPI000774C278|nr:SSI family serine proteinase inhibitor [Herbidospora cretacea]